MNGRSGVFIKYVIEFTIAPGGAGAVAGAIAGAAALATGAGATTKLTVSNDVLAADFCIDADISVKMHRWAAGSNFEIKLYDLPEPKVSALQQTPQKSRRLKISLGYFDTSVQVVLDGVYEEVNAEPLGDKLVTTIKGREAAFFACATTSYTGTLKGKSSYKVAIDDLLSQAPLPKDLISTKPQVNDNLPGELLDTFTFPGKVLFDIDKLAKCANAEFLIADGKVFFGKPVLNDLVNPAQLEYAVNLAKFDRITSMLIGGNGDPRDSNPEIPVNGFKFTVIGDPKMRPGQKVVVNQIEDYKSSEFRIRHVEHSFSSSAGYACMGVATEQLVNGETARSIDAVIDPSPASALTRFTDRIRSQPAENPVIEVTAVKSAVDNYQASLYYGQQAPGNETQASINVAINQQNDHVYQDKPIASPFAWRKCGLVTPVYQGMKAVVVHNRAQPSDAIVTGYIWLQQPDAPPPPNQSGDWWLCLPIDFDATQPPSDSTKAVNDITANNGRRVIELKGLKITVGAAKLAPVGTRPSEGPDDDFLIEHASGTSVHIDSSGALTIDASKTSMTIKGDVVIEGSPEIK